MGSHFSKKVQWSFQTRYRPYVWILKMQWNHDSGSVTHTLKIIEQVLLGLDSIGPQPIQLQGSQYNCAEGSDELTLFIKYESSGTPAGGTSKHLQMVKI